MNNKIKVVLKSLLLIVIIGIISISISFIPNFLRNPELFKTNPFYKLQEDGYLTLLVTQTIFFVVIQLMQKSRKDRFSHFDMIPQTILIYNALGKITFVNKFGCEKYKVDKDGIKGDSIINFLLESDRPRAIANATAYVKGTIDNIGSAASYKQDYTVNNYTTITSEGEELDTTVYVGKSGLLHLICIMVDNTDYEESAVNIEKPSEFFWGLLDSVPIPIVYNNSDGSFKFVNSAYKKLVNKGDDRILGRDVYEVLSEGDAEEAETKRSYAVNSGESLSYETQGYDKLLQIDIVPRFIDGKVDGTLGTIQDVTENRTKSILLKKEILLNKTLNKISERISNADCHNINKAVNDSLYLVRKTLRVCRAYILTSVNGEIILTNENIEKSEKPYQGLTLDMPISHKKYYEKIMAKSAVSKADNVKLSKYAPLVHLKIFKAKSMAEVSLPAASVSENDAVVGTCSTQRFKKWTDSELEFLTAAGRVILGAVDKLTKVADLKLSEETLNTLIDNTDIGIIISNITGAIYYQNTRFIDMFGEFASSNHMSVINRIAANSEREKAHKLFADREYKGYASGTIKVITKGNMEIFVKIYSSRIDYEGSKAYLTTIVDVSEYLVEEI